MCQYLLIQNKKVYTDLMFDGKEKMLKSYSTVQTYKTCLGAHNIISQYILCTNKIALLQMYYLQYWLCISTDLY